MNSIKKYFASWDFTRYFRMGLALMMLIGYFSTTENIYLVGAVFLSLQSILNFGCPGGSCNTNIPQKNDKPGMEFEKYEPTKHNN